MLRAEARRVPGIQESTWPEHRGVHLHLEEAQGRVPQGGHGDHDLRQVIRPEAPIPPREDGHLLLQRRQAQQCQDRAGDEVQMQQPSHRGEEDLCRRQEQLQVAG